MPQVLPHHKQQEKKRNYYFLILGATTQQVGRRTTESAGQVGNPSTDTASKINLSTTLFQKTGVLRGNAPKPVFAYFCLAAKVGRARGHETSPRMVGIPPRQAAEAGIRPCQKPPVPARVNPFPYRSSRIKGMLIHRGPPRPLDNSLHPITWVLMPCSSKMRLVTWFRS